MKRGGGIAELFAGIALIAFGIAPTSAAQTTTADDLIATGAVYAGQDAVAVRVVEATALRPGEVGRFQFGIRRFLSESDAATALDQSIDYALTDPRFGGLQQADAPAVGQRAAAVTGAVTFDGVDVVLAIVFVQDGRFLDSWVATALAGDLLPVLAGIAERFFSTSATPEPVTPPDATPTADDPAALLERLPTLDDLPTGYVLESEAAVAVDPPAEATPAA